jgi:serine/threonine-protein kinase
MESTLHHLQATVSFHDRPISDPPKDLMRRYNKLMTEPRVSWTAHPPLQSVLGKGGQGTVFLSERRGADGFTVPFALKVFSPERYEDAKAYDQAMARIARVASRVALIQHDHLINIQDFYDRNTIRIMAMEWVDGRDLRSILCNDLLSQIRDRVSRNRWDYINRVVVASGPVQPRVKPGIAVAIVRDCLGALAALHRAGIVHGDIKPGNIMLKRTGAAKIIDIGSAVSLDDVPPMRTCTPSYAAPEILEGAEPSGRSDLASVGYVLIELLAGRPVFAKTTNYEELLREKRTLHNRLEQLLPEKVVCNSLLMNFCRMLIAPDPESRFPNAEAAELVKGGAAAFHRQLVLSDLASEYGNEIRLWLEEITELDEARPSPDEN